MRAEPARLPSAHRRADPVRLRLVACSQHDAAAPSAANGGGDLPPGAGGFADGASSDDDRPAAEPGVVPLLDRREERIRVCVQNEHMFVAY